MPYFPRVLSQGEDILFSTSLYILSSLPFHLKSFCDFSLDKGFHDLFPAFSFFSECTVLTLQWPHWPLFNLHFYQLFCTSETPAFALYSTSNFFFFTSSSHDKDQFTYHLLKEAFSTSIAILIITFCLNIS